MRKLVIGNKNYSSWSMRAWTFLVESGLDFEEVRLPLYTPGWAEEVGRFSPARRVPVLVEGGVPVWDSLAIVLHVQRRHPGALGWPEDPRGYSLAAEMHSGFLALRDELPFNVRARRKTPDLSPAARDQVERLQVLFEEGLARSGGPFLFGGLTVPDLFFAPVLLRFQTYGIPVRAAAFAEAVRRLPSVARWCREAEAEEERIGFLDDLVPAAESPLSFG